MHPSAHLTKKNQSQGDQEKRKSQQKADMTSIRQRSVAPAGHDSASCNEETLSRYCPIGARPATLPNGRVIVSSISASVTAGAGNEAKQSPGHGKP